MTIWKVVLDSIVLTMEIKLPEGAEIIAVREQHGKSTLWAIVDPDKPVETRTIEMIRTGETFEPAIRKYLGTTMEYGGDYVLHVFERLTDGA